MGLTLTKVHQFEKVKDKNEWRLVKTLPYVRLRGNGWASPLFIQEGKVYSEGGDEATDLPSDFWDEAKKVSLEVRRECGLILPGEIVSTAPPANGGVEDGRPTKSRHGKRKAKPWICPRCGEETVSTRAGAHAMRCPKKE